MDQATDHSQPNQWLSDLWQRALEGRRLRTADSSNNTYWWYSIGKESHGSSNGCEEGGLAGFDDGVCDPLVHSVEASQPWRLLERVDEDQDVINSNTGQLNGGKMIRRSRGSSTELCKWSFITGKFGRELNLVVYLYNHRIKICQWCILLFV